MKIEAITSGNTSLSAEALRSSATDNSAALSDISNFNFYSAAKPASDKDKTLSLESIESARVKAMLGLNNAANATNHLAFSDANAALSELYLKNLAGIKIISKCTQCIEKLVNLQ
ncbi:hypothetical protein [Cedecea sp.]|jgi:hypothetical protein|uniref:hypothetical protein n=1 Tax=Cedecea sp. TaxID=1970739 RepID=UPI0012AE7E2F|nr:hypothetical protein [Enterobacteriaceae bacterium RIT693]